MARYSDEWMTEVNIEPDSITLDPKGLGNHTACLLSTPNYHWLIDTTPTTAVSTYNQCQMIL